MVNKIHSRLNKKQTRCIYDFLPSFLPSLYKVALIFSAKSVGGTNKVTILGKVLQVSEMLVPDRQRGFQMSIFLSIGHHMTTY